VAGIESNSSDGEYNIYHQTGILPTYSIWVMPDHGYELKNGIFGRYVSKCNGCFPIFSFDYHYKKEGGDIKKYFQQ